MRRIQDPETYELLSPADFYQKYPNRRPKPKAFQIIGDYESFQHIAGDGVKYERGPDGTITDIKLPVITSRAKHKEYLKRNGFEEAGNEKEHMMKYQGKTKENYEATHVDSEDEKLADFRYEEFDL